MRADLRVERNRGIAGKWKPTALVAYDLRLDSGRGRVRCDVDVGEQGDRRQLALDGRGKGRHHVAVLVKRGVSSSDLLELLDKQPGEVELLGGRRHRLGTGVRLRVDADITQETLERVGRGRASKLGPVAVVQSVHGLHSFDRMQRTSSVRPLLRSERRR